MKYLIATALAFLGISAFAQEPLEVSAVHLGKALEPTRQSVYLTNTIPGGTTESVNVGSGIDLRGWKSISLQLSGVAVNGSNASPALTLTFARSATGASPDNCVYETTPRFQWVVAAGGVMAGGVASTNTVVCFTNLPNDSISGASALKLISAASTTSNAWSSLTISVNRKR
jgi:hypothetical protein